MSIQINSCNLPYTFCEQIGKEIRDISDEIPFEIPDSWEWARLSFVCQLIDGTKQNGKYNNLDVRYMRGKGEAKILESGKYVEKETKLILVDGENSGEVFIAPENGYMGSTFKVLWISECLKVEYVLKFIEMYRKPLRDSKKGSAIPHLNKEMFFSLLLPLPPLAEQKRIVEKIEQLLPFIEKYEQAETQLTTLNTSFPEMLKKSILQEAVQGKLVPQNSDDEPASVLLERIRAEKQKLIKAGKIKKSKHESVIITRDKIPYEIPDSWVWCTLGSIINLVSGQDFNSCDFNAEEKGIPYLTGASNIIDEKIILNRWTDKPRCIANCGDLLIVCKGAGVGKMCILAEKKVHIARQIMSVKSTIVDIRYIKIFLRHNLILLRKSMQGVIPGISRDIILSMLLPLPPLAEQKRIVEKIEELMTFCEKLK